MSIYKHQVAIITGASTGIGRATALALAEQGFQVAIGARKADRLSDVAREIEAATGTAPFFHTLDVRNLEDIHAFVAAVAARYGRIDVLVNNAGLAKGLTPIADEQDPANWQQMLDTNVMGLLLMTRAVIPHMRTAGNGHIINLGSTAGREAYAGGAVYCATKFAVRALHDALRQELLGEPIRVTEVAPGMVETDFSVIRFDGDQARADAVYAGMTPLVAEDIADCIVWAATRKPHVNIDTIVIRPTEQSSGGKVARR